MIIRNEDIEGAVVEVPEGHHHVRVTIRLHSGQEITLMEAAMSNVLRAFVALKSHPTKRRVVLRGVDLTGSPLLKDGYAAWQLLEETDAEYNADKKEGG